MMCLRSGSRSVSLDANCMREIKPAAAQRRADGGIWGDVWVLVEAVVVVVVAVVVEDGAVGKDGGGGGECEEDFLVEKEGWCWIP
eukprot:8587525-Ditylum_brightwellii.AAC.1